MAILCTFAASFQALGEARQAPASGANRHQPPPAATNRHQTMPTSFLAPCQPITASDADIAAALEDGSAPTLLLSAMHMSGDFSLLDGPLRPQGCYLNEVQGFMSPEGQAEARALALDAIRRYRDRGHPRCPLPSDELVLRMMRFLVAEEVPPEYLALMQEEMALDGEDRRAVRLSAAEADSARWETLVIGAGMSGILAAIRLKQMGIPFTVVEKNPASGGTWQENVYPGCRVDVGNHFYCYSFEPNDDWSEFFCRQPELQRYFEGCIDRHALRENIRFGTEVTEARFDEARQRWRVVLRRADGGSQTVHAKALISATGQLNRPKMPDIRGLETFSGPLFHSARWRRGVELRGRRVAVIGTGASAFQILPEIAKEAERVYVFQRSGPWMFPNQDYHRAVPKGKRWLLRHLPGYARWYRFLLFWPATDGLLPALKIDPEWPHQDRSINALNDAVYTAFTDWMKQQVDADRPELLAKVIPDYVPLGKRTLQDNGAWLAALQRDNVELVDKAAAELRPDAVVDADGVAREVDAVICATGFHANRYLWPMRIVGRNGVVLSEQWGEEPSAYMGITAPNFPNLFCMYGPGTNLAFGGSMIFHGECQMRYIANSLKLLLEGGYDSMELREQAHREYRARLFAEHETMIWSHPSIKHSWYQNAAGRVTVLSPWRLLDYWRWTAAPDPAHYVLR